MARLVELHPEESRPVLRRTQDKDRRLADWITFEVEQALSARHAQEEAWREAKRQYSGVPRQPYRNTPVPNAPNIEVPLGSVATDAQYASITDTLYAGSPLLTVRAQDEEWVQSAKAMQRWANYCAEHEFGLRAATDHAFFDCCQLGTGVFYVPFVEDVYKSSVYNVRRRGARILPVAPENFIVPGGSRGEVQYDRWSALRFWYQPDEMRLRAKLRNWDMTKAMPVASIDWVRRRHEHLGMTDGSSNWREQYEVLDVYAHYDYNGDGEDLDLLVHWDRSSRYVLDVMFNPYDTRPNELCRYQLRPHLAYGLGIMEMLRPLQDEVTEIHTHRIVNMMIANARVWIALQGTVPESMEIWPNKVIESTQPDMIKQLPMGDVYPSSLQAEVASTAIAERRVGMEGAPTGARPHAIGTRTPGITALSVAQAQNRRFTPAFDSMRFAALNTVKQGFLRQRERLLLGDTQVEDHINEVLGETDGRLVIDLLKEPHFDHYVQVEFTAVSPSTNREADRQNAVLVWNSMRQYYTETMQLVGALANPQTPPEMVQIGKQVIEKANEMADRFLRTFDQIRDPQAFLLKLQGGELDAIAQRNQEQQGLQGLAQLLASASGGQAPENGAQPPVDTGVEGATP